MTTILKGNIVSAPACGRLDVTEHGYLIAENGVVSMPVAAKMAKRVRKVLEGVVNNGTGKAAAISGVQIAGKTGTAETGKEKDDRWFVGMGPSDDCSVVVAVVLEEAGEQLSGGAAGRAQGVLKAALEVQGEL